MLPYMKERGYPRTLYKTLKNIKLNNRKFWTSPKLDKKREIIGIDTETLEGYIKVITDSNGEYLWIKDNEENPALKLLEFLSYEKYRGKWLEYYNISYDFSALLKYLPDKNKDEIYESPHSTVYKDYKIRSVPKLSFKITRGKNTIFNYNIAQFYKMSLDRAVKQYLNPSSKELETLKKFKKDRAILFKKYEPPEIIKYCVNDAIYTKRLAELFQNNYERMFETNMPKPFSPAKLMETYLKTECQIPKIKNFPSDLLETAYRAFYGGRMEVTRRGSFKSAYKYDLNSAYPYIMSQLIDVELGEWRSVREIHEKAEYGFYKAIVDVDMEDDWYIAPLPFRLKGKTIIFPNGKWIGFYSKDELEQVDKYKIIYGYEFYPSRIERPFFEAVNKLYEIRCEETDPIGKKLCKSMLLSGYGKTCQVSGGKMGFLFNSVYATVITSKLRKIMYDIRNEDMICYATDGIITSEPVNNLNIGDKLGQWKIEVSNKPAIVIKTGIYQIDNQTGSRGFPELWDKLKESQKRKTINTIYSRPESLGEGHKAKNYENLNIWKIVKTQCDINGDPKRDWFERFKNVEDMLSRSMYSSAFTLGFSRIPEITEDSKFYDNPETYEKV